MKKIKAVHFCVIPRSNNNAGDNLLYELIRLLIDHYLTDVKIEWLIKSQWEISSASDINKLDVDLALFGGGGLFLPDQKGANQSNNTGWQINIPPREYEKIKPYIYGAAIGFNWFRRSKYPKFLIKDSATSFIKKSNLLGIRNYGSINEITNITGISNNLYWQPCPTTLINKLCLLDIKLNFPEAIKKIILSKNKISEKKKYNIALNLSCDRLDQRGIKLEDFKKLRLMLLDLVKKGHLINYLAHKDLDLEACKSIGEDVFNKVVNISNLSKETVIKEYKKMDIVFGGRGHSLMIPIGLKIPIISITTHDKQKFFMSDVGLEKFSIELQKLSDYEINLKIKKLLANIKDQFILIDKYQNLGIKAWKNYISIINSNHKG